MEIAGESDYKKAQVAARSYHSYSIVRAPI